jgi:hypothetical protein
MSAYEIYNSFIEIGAIKAAIMTDVLLCVGDVFFDSDGTQYVCLPRYQVCCSEESGVILSNPVGTLRESVCPESARWTRAEK